MRNVCGKQKFLNSRRCFWHVVWCKIGAAGNVIRDGTQIAQHLESCETLRLCGFLCNVKEGMTLTVQLWVRYESMFSLWREILR